MDWVAEPAPDEQVADARETLEQPEQEPMGKVAKGLGPDALSVHHAREQAGEHRPHLPSVESTTRAVRRIVSARGRSIAAELKRGGFASLSSEGRAPRVRCTGHPAG